MAIDSSPKLAAMTTRVSRVYPPRVNPSESFIVYAQTISSSPAITSHIQSISTTSGTHQIPGRPG